ncbi:MAG: hypothetical protein AAFO04_00140 [Cyanobacteria bacterium J06592_8]
MVIIILESLSFVTVIPHPYFSGLWGTEIDAQESQEDLREQAKMIKLKQSL